MNIPRLSFKEATILRLLVSGEEMSGLELIEAAQGELKRGAIYITLGILTDKGYVESRQVPAAALPGALQRRLFRCSGFGKRVLATWELAEGAILPEYC